MPGEQDFDYDLDEDDTELSQLRAESGGLDDLVIERITKEDKDYSCYSCSDNGKECDGVECPECYDCLNWCECARCKTCHKLYSSKRKKDKCKCKDCDCEFCLPTSVEEDDVNADQSRDLATDSEASAVPYVHEQESPFKEVVNLPGLPHADNPREAGARSGKFWTYGEVAELKARFRAGGSIEEMAGALGRTPISVMLKLYRLELVDALDLDAALHSGLDRYKRAEQKAKGREPF